MPPHMKRLRLLLPLAVALLLAALPLTAANDNDAFTPSLTAERDPQGALVTVAFAIAPGAYLYEESVSLTVEGTTVTLDHGDPPDDRDGERLFTRSFTRVYRVAPVSGNTLTATIAFQGCLPSGLCLLPQRKTLTLTLDNSQPANDTTPAPPTAQPSPHQLFEQLADQFDVAGTLAGFADRDDFIAWLDRAQQGRGAPPDDNLLANVFRRHGLLLAALLLIPLGLLLNLTPCVLPMIPVTLAVLGAGAKNGQTRGRGFALGLAYGLGMALAYGALGAAVAVSGGQFGALNASPWFNAAVAAVFLVLALAMLDVLSIDLTRLRGAALLPKPERGRLAGAFLMGALSAVLAGACVAPVLIWTLILATGLHSAGNPLGLLLPFLLGVGMALPWPLLGAGLARLPRPGAWMMRIRQLFALIMLVLALHYANVSRRQFTGADADGALPLGWRGDLLSAMSAASAAGQPLLIDCWGTACKNCTLMDELVLPDPAVVRRLQNITCVKFKADDPDDPLAQAVLARHAVRGFPTFILLTPRK